jgi:hypothetical protein
LAVLQLNAAVYLDHMPVAISHLFACYPVVWKTEFEISLFPFSRRV